ncbi:MAG: acyltransferase [Paracoccaceae bacterium]
MMIWLGAAAQGRDNNFNLIRMLAASAVLVSHTWPMVYGPGTIEPLEMLTGHTLGSFAVYVFFALSGFFISASFARSGSVLAFLAARCLRLFPSLAVSLFIVALILGPLATSLSTADYLADRETWTFLVRNMTLWHAQYTLPGVFEVNPYPAVEGSIWTLIQEVMCYGLVFLAGIAGLLWRRQYMTAALFGYAALWLWPVAFSLPLPIKLTQLHELSLPFVLGMTFWLWRDRIPLSLVGIAGLAVLAFATRETLLALPAMMLFLTYTIFWLGHVPQGWVRRYNKLGDYSYGMYVYAFPLQGAVVWLWGPMLPTNHIVAAFPITLIFAILSWHFVEAPALALRWRAPAKEQRQTSSVAQRKGSG